MSHLFKYTLPEALFCLVFCIPANGQFRVYPYIQYPARDEMTVIWFSDNDSSGMLTWQVHDNGHPDSLESIPSPVAGLGYSLWEDTAFFDGHAPSYPYKHRVRLEHLESGMLYDYSVRQDFQIFHGKFRTAPAGNQAIRFIAYGDSETEPESTGKFTEWDDPQTGNTRPYLVDQTSGYSHNLSVIKSRSPDLILIAGDLVETGGIQRNWDEFWKHNARSDTSGIAGNIPILAAPGNHDYYAGENLGGYNLQGSEYAINKYLSYFESPLNQAENPLHEGHYYSLQYGPASFIVLDVCNNGLNESNDDTNFYLSGESDTAGGSAPDFGPGSLQYQWLEESLIEAQQRSIFTFVLFHHAPYSSGPHGLAPGLCDTCNVHSGRPVRMLTDLFMKYGVDAVISGHDELWERSSITGSEVLPADSSRLHTLQFYDVGIGGDGLRKPSEGTNNPFRRFLAHLDEPEIWQNNILVDGGKHYGHLEVNIYQEEIGLWQAKLTPVYVFPLFDPSDSTYSGFERRIYDDEIILSERTEDITTSVNPLNPDKQILIYPNPFMDFVRFNYPVGTTVTISFYDMTGSLVKSIIDHDLNGESQADFNNVNPGLYVYRLVDGSGITYIGKLTKE